MITGVGHGQTLKLSRIFASLFGALRSSGEAKTEVIPRRHKMPPYAQSLATIKSPDNPRRRYERLPYSGLGTVLRPGGALSGP